MVQQTLKLAGREFVVVAKADFERLKQRAAVIEDIGIPPLPEKLKDGTYPALQAGRTILAQKLIRRRRGAGLTQAELARRARIRPETLNRIEKAKVTADTVTVSRIIRALERAEREVD